ncbi:MAG TPA: YebC/PmpR family DNA-binding transcriptional regulator [Candidatus Thiothrix moscowensis]|uniref:YebC/PmpR family DNA-binding transcriptional regulator n=1 Tax=unclassified Thiothrix TaxID=2636184 RepID=UPI001A28D75B|nr:MULTISPECIES: YebC/PmpR family DNA-binding transcriptional regulator [unclassified Thiothrix]MBJ6610720.1 YebC/PmpR family DNA-binding transcriptional regulator [Candidatus Thiothrix moscowensis]HRJ54018.1 YebC/PmpR family DNA-binding transcriptional regulator [Candidatus Thiothrix moscowensis]HRJ94100.1 YebC/PmpR family DNA-binding transcriptional regulator [Candidatus Thiothrix moscowensis]
MAGHSKWANIKHQKAAVDKKRGKIWTKIIREITVAAREGKTSDPNAHPRLRLAVDKALGANMPKDTIEKACKRGAGETSMENYSEVRYEGYGPGGIAVIIETMTDNVNRTVGEVRHALTKHGGNLGTSGSVAFQFKKIGVMNFAPGIDEEKLMEAALEAGADDIQMDEDGSAEIITAPEDFAAVKTALIAAGFTPDHDEVTMRADNLTAVEGDTAEKLLKMIDMLEDLDDVQEVYTNADFSDESLESHG